MTIKLIRYVNTLRYLRPVQIYGRIWQRLNPAKPKFDPAPQLRLPSGQWVKSVERTASMLSDQSFRFLNVVGQVRCAAGWNDPAQEKLWLYNLHYFDDLNAAGANNRLGWHRALMSRWIIENPQGLGNGWEPYPTSLRLVNWLKWALAGNKFESGWVDSLAVQARWLRQHIEWHLLGNHLFANAKALVFAGLFFEGHEAAEWLAQGLKILDREVPEQVLPDGGHVELSPMYHAIILEDLLDLVNVAKARPGQVPEATVLQWHEIAERMLPWLKGLIHPDGQIAFFNDAAWGIAPDYETLAAYALRLGIDATPVGPRSRCTHFADSGYVRLQQDNAVALLDVARIGPDYLPGHAHADTLSFELSLFGQRVVVNSGISQYGLGAERLRQRGTSAHSTVEVDGADSSEVWGGFRVARRARPFGLAIEENEHSLVVTCSHDGYRRLSGKPVHRRHWRLDEHALQVSDFIKGDFRTAVARYYLYPSVRVIGAGKEGQLQLSDGRAVRWSVSGGSARVVAASWHPEFGLSIPCKLIEMIFDGHETRFEFTWD